METLNEKDLNQVAGGAKGDYKLIEYVVQKGDTLSGIAARYGINWKTGIYEREPNRSTIGDDPNWLGVGMRLWFYVPEELA